MKYTAKTQKKVRELYDEGIPVKDITLKTGVSSTTVYNWIKGSRCKQVAPCEPRWAYFEKVLKDGGWSFARFEKESGLWERHLYRWRTGFCQPSLDNFIVICKTLELVDGKAWMVHAVIMLANEEEKNELRK